MDVLHKLQSILGPQGLPANNAYRPDKAVELKTTSFTRALAQASKPIPTVLPEIPGAETEAAPKDPPTVGKGRESLEEAIRVLQGNPVVRGGGDGSQGPESPTIVDSRPAAPVVVKQPAVGASTSSALPPLGMLWGSMLYRGSGARGPGIGGTDAEAQATLGVKFGSYTEPTRSRASLNQEARLFLDAVSKGYVDDSPEGLGTLLSYLSKGSIGADARPPMITAYFNQFYAAERAAGR